MNDSDLKILSLIAEGCDSSREIAYRFFDSATLSDEYAVNNARSKINKRLRHLKSQGFIKREPGKYGYKQSYLTEEGSEVLLESL